MDRELNLKLLKRNFLFWLSRMVDYPLVAPDMLQLCFTFRCNLRCKMCNMEEKLAEFKKLGKPHELSASLMKDLILQAHNLGINEVFFVGGEPFLSEDIFDLIAFAAKLGMQTTVSTNGVLLDNVHIEKVLDSKLTNLSCSIDGPDKETHDSIRGEGVFEKAVANLRALISKKMEMKLTNPKIIISCTIMKQNIVTVPEMVNFAKQLGADCVQFQPVVADNTDQSHDIISDTWIDEKTYPDLDRSIGRLRQLKDEDSLNFIASSSQQLKSMPVYFRRQFQVSRRCYAGFNRLMVTQDRKIYFCAADPKTGELCFGDVAKTPLRTIWRSERAKEFRRYIKKCRRPCLLFCAYRSDFDVVRDLFTKAALAFILFKKILKKLKLTA